MDIYRKPGRKQKCPSKQRSKMEDFLVFLSHQQSIFSNVLSLTRTFKFLNRNRRVLSLSWMLTGFLPQPRREEIHSVPCRVRVMNAAEVP
jgi:hypothetical protein